VLDFYNQRDIRQTALRVQVFGLGLAAPSNPRVFLSNGGGLAAPLTISPPQRPADRVAYERQTKITASKFYVVIYDVPRLPPSSHHRVILNVSFSFLVYSQSWSPSFFLFSKKLRAVTAATTLVKKIKKLRVANVKEIRHCVVVYVLCL